MSKRAQGNIMLAVAAFIWGTAFVAQRSGMDHIGPLTFTCVRSFIGALALLPVALIFDKKPENREKDKKDLLLGGILCGCCLVCATSFQQIGIQYTTAGKAGFITALYIVLVPVFSFIFLKKRPNLMVWISVIIATAGLYLLCMTESFTLAVGDIWILACAFVFTLHILVIDHFSPKCNGVMLSMLQFFVVGVLAAVPMIILEEPNISDIVKCAGPLLYTGVLSSGVAYTLQILGQEHTDPTVAVLIMSFESVFAALAGWIVLKETLSTAELFGCVLMFVAVILSQLPERKHKA
ncbi:MAG: DMT family transporter [Anaerofustis stercorihominis]|nr:DMT family transporter [Anaerofustis stercorihominis]